METFLNWINGDMGVPGEYAYQSIHIYSTIVVLIYLVIISLIAKSTLNDSIKRKVLKGIAIFQFAFEISWRLIYHFVRSSPFISLWPTYPCNLGGVLVPIICLLDSKSGKNMFYLFAFIGRIVTFAMPNGIFYKSVLTFPILKSILQHTGILAIPLFEYLADYYKPSIKHAFYILIGLLVHIFNSHYFSHKIGLVGDFSFVEMKIPCEIEGVPQIVTTTVSGYILLLIIAIIINIKDFKSLFNHN